MSGRGKVRLPYLQCTSIAVHIRVVTRFNVFTCPCQQVNHGSLSTTHAHSVTYPFDCVSLLSASRRPKTIFPQMLATAEQKPNLEQSTSELSKCLTVLSDARIRWHCCTKRMCVDVSDVLINVASDRSDHQCCGSCMAFSWLLLLCQLGCQKWKVFQCCCRRRSGV